MISLRTILASAVLIIGVTNANTQTFTNDAKPQRLHTPKTYVKAAVPKTKAYGWLLRDRGALENEKGLVEFNIDAPESISKVFKLADKAWAGAYADGAYYFYRYKDDSANQNWIPLAFSKLDIAAGKFTDIASWSDRMFIFTDMTYDYSTGTMYALSREIYQDDFLGGLTFEYSGLYSINLTTGTEKQLKQFINWSSGALANPTYLTLAADFDGNIYTIDINGVLYRLDRDNDWEAIKIGDTGRRPTTAIQSMDFDPSTGMIFWAADYKTQVSDFCMIDPANAKTQIIGALGTDSRLCGLHIDIKIPKEGAPAGVTDLVVANSMNGEAKAEINWTNPTKTFGKAKLSTISKVKLLRDDMMIAEWNSPAIGASMSYTDAASVGYHTYSVIASNILGDGLERKAVAWVGRDVPDVVGKPGIGRNDDGSAVIQWETPQGGLHGGWVDFASLKYRITRYPDGKVVETAATGNEFVDNSISSVGKFRYEIVPYTIDGEGKAASTVEIALGNLISNFPYNCLFEDISVFNTWTIVNANGGSTWSWKKRGLSDFDAFAMYMYDNNNTGDDYLISPALWLEKGKEYTFKFNYRGSNANHTEKFEAVFGREATKEGMSAMLKSYSVKSGDGAYDLLTLPEITEDGIYYVGFHAISDPKMFNLYITDVTVNCIGGTTPPDPDEFPAPTDLKPTVKDDDCTVTLTWNGVEIPGVGINTAIDEDFESYTEWVLNPTGTYAWSYIDEDGGIPYRSDYADMPYPTDGQPCAAMIMAPYLLSKDVYEPNPPHSGDKYLLFKSNFSAGDGSKPAPKPSDYFISPRLNFNTDFVFSFWCKADPDLEAASQGLTGSDVWNRENFLVGYSISGNTATDFIWFTDNPEVVISTGETWTKKEYAVPGAAKYVCIKYCTQDCGFWFMVDDVYIGPPKVEESRMNAKTTSPSFKTYDIYLDDVHVGSTAESFYVLDKVASGEHIAKVIAVYEEGESAPAEVTFTIKQPSSLNSILSNENVLDIYSIEGILLKGNATANDFSRMPTGIYIIKTGSQTLKLFKK